MADFTRYVAEKDSQAQELLGYLSQPLKNNLTINGWKYQRATLFLADSQRNKSTIDHTE